MIDSRSNKKKPTKADEYYRQAPAPYEPVTIPKGVKLDEAATEPEEPEEKPRHRFTKVLLIIAIIVLLIVGGTIALISWHDSMGTDTGINDTETLTTDDAGTQTITFTAIDSSVSPDLVGAFNKTKSKAISASKGKLKIGKRVKVSKKHRVVSGQRYKATGSVLDASGSKSAEATFGFNKKKKLLYIQATFDLDDLGVTEANIEQLAKDDTIARSLLRAVGLSKANLKSAKLTTSNISTSSDGSKSTFTLSGSFVSEKNAAYAKAKKAAKAARKKAHKKHPSWSTKKLKKKYPVSKYLPLYASKWELEVTYDNGTTLMRTATVTLK